MADRNILTQVLENLVNDNQAKAEELFHDYVVAKSREIYEELIESEIQDEEVEEDTEVDEAADDLDEESEVDESSDDLEENFDDIAVEADEEEMDHPDMTGDLEMDADMGHEMGDDDMESNKEPEELLQDLDRIVDELQAKFDEMNGMGGDDMGDMDDMEHEEGYEPELATVREYVEKVPMGHGAEKKGSATGQMAGAGTGEMGGQKGEQNVKSTIDNMKNDMGGTTANILSSKEDPDNNRVGSAGGQLKGTGVFKGTPKEENFGNINVPGGKAGKTGFTHKEPGHGAEKKGSATGQLAGAGTGEVGGQKGEQNTQSLFRGRR
jgi:hypothetical protein